MKACNKCLIEKLETEFKKDPRNKDGLQGICKACNKGWQRSRRNQIKNGIGVKQIIDKQCNKCLTTKPVSDFYKDTGSTDGHHSLCKVCRNESMSKWRENNRDKYNKNMRDWRKNNPDEVKDHDLRRTYGIGLDEYNKMKEVQNHTCAICKKPPKGKRPLVVDHEHSTTNVRGLLCYKCNRDMAVVDDTEHLDKLIAYRDKKPKESE